MKYLLFGTLLVLISVSLCYGKMTSTLDVIGTGLWNARQDFYVMEVVDIGMFFVGW
jgi:hypothetical protein